MSKLVNKLAREEELEALREGRKVRAVRFRARKGRGSYTRKEKHK